MKSKFVLGGLIIIIVAVFIVGGIIFLNNDQSKSNSLGDLVKVDEDLINDSEDIDWESEFTQEVVMSSLKFYLPEGVKYKKKGDSATYVYIDNKIMNQIKIDIWPALGETTTDVEVCKAFGEVYFLFNEEYAEVSTGKVGEYSACHVSQHYPDGLQPFQEVFLLKYGENYGRVTVVTDEDLAEEYKDVADKIAETIVPL